MGMGMMPFAPKFQGQGSTMGMGMGMPYGGFNSAGFNFGIGPDGKPFDTTVGKRGDGFINSNHGQVIAPGIEARLMNQDRLTTKGLKDGKLNPMEMFSLIGDRMHFEQMKEQFMSDGKLDFKERLALHKELNDTRKDINQFTKTV